jgi:hypothetical protein
MSIVDRSSSYFRIVANALSTAMIVPRRRLAAMPLPHVAPDAFLELLERLPLGRAVWEQRAMKVL